MEEVCRNRSDRSNFKDVSLQKVRVCGMIVCSSVIMFRLTPFYRLNQFKYRSSIRTCQFHTRITTSIYYALHELRNIVWEEYQTLPVTAESGLRKW